MEIARVKLTCVWKLTSLLYHTIIYSDIILPVGFILLSCNSLPHLILSKEQREDHNTVLRKTEHFLGRCKTVRDILPYWSPVSHGQTTQNGLYFSWAGVPSGWLTVSHPPLTSNSQAATPHANSLPQMSSIHVENQTKVHHALWFVTSTQFSTTGQLQLTETRLAGIFK